MSAGGVPTGCGDGSQNQGRQEHGGCAAVLATAECAAGLDNAAGSGADCSVVGPFCANVTAGRAFEGTRGCGQFGAGGSG
jgi:hypothetical protein